jgi:hypothetical protein
MQVRDIMTTNVVSCRTDTDLMPRQEQASTCRWAVPTLFLAPPIWFYAWDAPWTCVRRGAARVLGSADQCCGCPGWEPAAVRGPREDDIQAVSRASPEAYD